MDGQELVPSISSKFWILAFKKSALIHFEGIFMLGLVLSVVAGFFCLLLLRGFSF